MKFRHLFSSSKISTINKIPPKLPSRFFKASLVVLLSINISSSFAAETIQNELLTDTSPIKVAAINAAPVRFDVEASLKKADRLVKEAKAQGAVLVAFPELWLPGFINGDPQYAMGMPPKPFSKYVDNSIEVGSKEWKELLKIASDNHVYLSMGISEKNTKTKNLYMTQILVGSDGVVIDKRSKINPSRGERGFFSDAPMADNLKVVNTPLGRIGQLSCGEHFKVLMTYNMMAQHENIHIAAWPYNLTARDKLWREQYWLHMVNTASYASNSNAWTIMPSIGRATIFDNNGFIIAQADNTNSNFVIAEIDRSGFKSTDGKSDPISYNTLSLLRKHYPGPHEPKEAVETLSAPDYTKIQ